MEVLVLARVEEPSPPAFRSLTDVPVTIIRWPEERDREAELARLGALRLLLVSPDAMPPADWDQRCDWIRLPADDADVLTRISVLQRRVQRVPAPHLDEFGVLWRGSRWVGLSPTETRLMAALLARVGIVQSRVTLGAAASSQSVPGSRVVDTYVRRLRQRIARLGLAIRTVRGRGYFLEVMDAIPATEPAESATTRERQGGSGG